MPSGTTLEVRVKPLEVEAWNNQGESITSGDISSVRFKECEYHNMPVYVWFNKGDEFDGEIFDKEGWYTSSDFDYPAHIIEFKNQSDVLVKNGLDPAVLYTVYNSGCTGIEQKILNQKAKPSPLVLVTSCASVVTGCLTIIIGALAIIGAIKALMYATALDPVKFIGFSIALTAGVPLLVGGIGSLLSGIGLLTAGSVGIDDYRKSLKDHEEDCNSHNHSNQHNYF